MFHFIHHNCNVLKSFSRNEAAPGDTSQHNTRFMALASVGNSTKQKWLYALNIVPMEHMRASELYQGTTDETKTPFPGLAFFPNPKGSQVNMVHNAAVFN